MMITTQIETNENNPNNQTTAASPASSENILTQEHAWHALDKSLWLIERAKQEWEVTADALPQLVCLFDDQGRVERANRTIERWGLGRVNEIEGVHLHDLFHPGCSDPACYLADFWSEARTRLTRNQTAVCEAADRALRRHLQFQIRPLSPQAAPTGTGGSSFGVMVVQDITERKQAEQKLRQANDALERRVEERTAELAGAIAALKAEISQRERTEMENARLHIQTKNRARALATLNIAGQTLTSTLDLDTILRRLMVELNAFFNSEDAAVLMYQSAGNELVLVAAAGARGKELVGASIPVAGSIAGLALQREQSMLFDETGAEQGDYALIKALTGPTDRSLLVAPLICKQKTIGVVQVVNRASHNFVQHDLEILEILADSAAIAIENARLFEEVRHGREQLRQLAQQVVAAQEDERQRLSHELHDEAGQNLTALKLMLEMLQMNLPDKPELLRERLGEAVKLVGTTMEGLRALARDLRPPALDAVGLNVTLENLCHDFANWAHVAVDYQGVKLNNLSDSANICLYRFLQEALTNIAKHAQARHVWVKLQANGDRIKLLVADDGRGFDQQAGPTGPKGSNGMGLVGMQERFKLLGGRLEIDTHPGQGTCLIAYLPREDKR